MKKTLLFLVVLPLFISCGSTKMEREAMQTFKGDWILTEINYPENSGFVDVNFFKDASADCFQNSIWHFISNNNEGNYQLSGEDCATEKRNFTWNLNAADNPSPDYKLTLKPVGEDENARKLNSGFRVDVTYLSDNQMTWRQKVQYQGEPFTIEMKFAKNY